MTLLYYFYPMKSTYLPLSLFLWLAACSSPAAQNTAQNATPKQDTSVEQNTSENPAPKQNTTAATAGDTITKYATKAEIFLNTDDLTVPPYGLDKIKTLVAKIKFREDDGIGGTEALDE